MALTSHRSKMITGIWQLCSSKFELKVASCDEQTVNQYWNIAPQHCRVPIKRTSGLTVSPTSGSEIHSELILFLYYLNKKCMNIAFLYCYMFSMLFGV